MSGKSTRLNVIYRDSKLKSPYKKLSLARRYWIYQWERLPFLPLLLMASSVSLAVMRANHLFSWPRLVAATTIISAYLLQIRFADEPKDYEHDNEFYPTRPVQRGVITLNELRRLRNLMITIFFVTALVLRSSTVIMLAGLQQLYSWLTRQEFFMRDWLRRHFLIYMFSHYFQLLILNWLALTILNIPLRQKPIYMGFTLLLTAIVELARKINAADNDSAGDTYSAALGRARAVGYYLALVASGVIYLAWLLNHIKGHSGALWLIDLSFGFAVFAAIRYYRLPNDNNTRILQASSLAYYLLGAITLIVGSSVS